MTWKALFFGFDGRIGRRQWWLATLALLLVFLPLSVLVNPGAYFDEAKGLGSQTAETLLGLAFLIPGTAVAVKRFNDRNWPQFLPYAVALCSLASLLLVDFQMVLASRTWTMPDLVVLSLNSILSIFVLIDNGMLRGTRGPNRHGPDPLMREPEPARKAGLHLHPAARDALPGQQTGGSP